ncbi:MAG: polysaccharide deacetylase family protein [Clostridiales Family XIII bacterium]|jgi:uncharacterized repeat protein (TIGR02543 family)|nr:polysaccharide deacetylase family protein [Clostridiales Family XIII bacterium]
MRKYRARKRIFVIPAVFIAALFIAGEIYSVLTPVPPAGDVASHTFATEALPDKETEEINEAPKSVEVTFYAGDASVTTLQIWPNAEGGYRDLPEAEKDGYEFEGWYTERTGGDLVSKTHAADIDDGDTLYARWYKRSFDVDQSVKGLPVLMYHWFYDTTAGDKRPTRLLNNWMEASQFEDEMVFLKEDGWYFPTWDEVYAYVLGEIDLPDKSIVVTIDDGAKSFYKYAAPILEKNEVRGTGFIIASEITEEKVWEYSSEYVSLQSHTWDMHDGNGGKGLIQLLPFDEAVADLTSASAILGTSDALAYPFGYYDDETADVCEAAGVRMAFGVSGGKVYPGMDPLCLPRVRISSTQSLETFKQVYGW